MNYLYILRPLQWIKNLLIFAPIFFAKTIFVQEKLISATYGFIAFCFAASTVYVINDLIDRDKDKLHPIKQFRPIVAGKISLFNGILYATFLTIFTGIFVCFYAPALKFIILIYFILNFSYSFYFKNKVILDILIFTLFYLLRIIAGGICTDTFVSKWLIFCIIFGTLFIITAKRKSEFNHKKHREVFKFYNSELLNQFLIISATLTLSFYSLYTVFAIENDRAVYSVLFVMLGVFRYLYIVYNTNQAESPEKLIISDKMMLGNILSWLIFMYYIFYY